jgi:four helix bundle protein
MENQTVRTYKDLEVWQKGVALAETCYQETAQFPKEEMYGLQSQIRRAAVSVSINIAEGHGRESTGAFVQALRVAQGSIKEIETLAIIASRVGVLGSPGAERIASECDTIGRMLRGLIRSLQRKQSGSDTG